MRCLSCPPHPLLGPRNFLGGRSSQTCASASWRNRNKSSGLDGKVTRRPSISLLQLHCCSDAADGRLEIRTQESPIRHRNPATTAAVSAHQIRLAVSFWDIARED